MQLDIFDHSRDVMLRNDVVHALERRDAAAWEILAKKCPADESLPALLVLTEAIEASVETAFCDHDCLGDARQALQDRIEPAALRTFGDKDGAAWLCPLWQSLAQRAAPGPARPGGAPQCQRRRRSTARRSRPCAFCWNCSASSARGVIMTSSRGERACETFISRSMRRT